MKNINIKALLTVVKFWAAVVALYLTVTYIHNGIFVLVNLLGLVLFSMVSFMLYCAALCNLSHPVNQNSQKNQCNQSGLQGEIGYTGSQGVIGYSGNILGNRGK
jgi:hypothetical protein